MWHTVTDNLRRVVVSARILSIRGLPVTLVDTAASMFIDQKLMQAQHHRTCLCFLVDCVRFLCSHDHSITELNVFRVIIARGCYSSRWGLSDMSTEISTRFLLVRM